MNKHEAAEYLVFGKMPQKEEMNKYTKIVSFDVGTERPTEEYTEHLQTTNADLLEACIKARIFIEYAIYELKDGKAKFGSQFPHKEDGYIEMNRLAEAIRKASQ